MITRLVRRQVIARAKAQGIGRHSAEEIRLLAARDLEALSARLGDKRYVVGEQPRATDAVVHALVVGVMTPFFPGSLRDAALAHDNLVSYVARFDALWYG